MVNTDSSEWETFLQTYSGSETIPEKFEIRWQYYFSALCLGRPVEKVMIVSMGQCGTGKSATINNLFGDDSLCHTHPSKTTTHDVTEYGKQIDLPDFKAWLNFVDTPGTLDIDGRDSDNMRTIENFRNSHRSLQHNLVGDGNERLVYPNIVLVTVNAIDERLEGEQSQFTQTLKIIKETNLLDFDRINLIVVVTHCAALGNDKNEFILKKQAKMNAIARVLPRVLKITTVKIVFVENLPLNKLQKQKNGDFYMLPDGELTPYNLFEAIRDQLRSNEDYLGSLVIARYFNTACQERSKKADILSKFFVDRNTQSVMNNRPQFRLRNFSYRYLVRGYTPPIQSTRSYPVFPLPVITDVNALFQTTSGIAVSRKQSILFSQISTSTKDQYQKSWKTRVGLGDDINLSLSPIVTAVGKWGGNGNGSIMSFMYEISLKKAKQDISRSSSTKKCFTDDINALPDHDGWLTWVGSWVHTPESNEKFDLFFDRWGTHFISRVMIGGSVRVDVSITSDYSEDQEMTIRNDINQKLNSLTNGTYSNMNMECDTVIVFSGGRPPNIGKLQDLTPEIFSAWEESINDHPVELEHTIKLIPYYDLIDNQKKRAYFKKAVVVYLENYGKRYSVRRNAEALKEETTARMFAAAWFSENRWSVAAAIATAVVAGVGPGAAVAVVGSIMTKILKR